MHQKMLQPREPQRQRESRGDAFEERPSRGEAKRPRLRRDEQRLLEPLAWRGAGRSWR